MKLRQRRYLQGLYAAVRGLALLGILLYLARQILLGKNELDGALLNWNATELAAALVLAAIAYQLLPLAWMLMLRRSGLFKAGHFGMYTRIWWISYIYRYVPGKVLLLVERTRLGTKVGIPAGAGAAMPIFETLVALFAGSIVSLLAISYYSPVTREIFAIIMILGAFAALLVPVGISWLAGLAWMRRHYPDLQSLKLRTSDLLVILLPYLAHYLLLGAAFFLVCRSLYPLERAALPGISGIYALSHVLSLLVVLAPGGLGVREGALAVQLQQIVPAGIAGALAIGARAFFTIVELLCLSLALWLSQPLPVSGVARTKQRSVASPGKPPE